MRKLCVAAACLLLLAPLNAFADSIGVASLKIQGSTPNVNVQLNGSSVLWAGDYDIIGSALGTSGLQLNSNEVFCTENATLISSYTDYAFYRIDSTLNTDYSGGDDAYIEKLKEATWLANYAYKGTEEQKAVSQLAIWNVMFGAVAQTYSAEVTKLLSAYAKAGDKYSYVNDWLLAVSPATTNGEIKIGVSGQNFLVNASVPEPATMLLFGTGIAGLAGIARRKRD